jgi:hypothetical protein
MAYLWRLKQDGVATGWRHIDEVMLQAAWGGEPRRRQGAKGHEGFLTTMARGKHKGYKVFLNREDSKARRGTKFFYHKGSKELRDTKVLRFGQVVKLIP